MTTLALTFNGVTLSPISHKNQTWLSACELSKALGYSQSDAVTKIYNRNKDEFNNSMTTILSNAQIGRHVEFSGFHSESRLFSLRGCHLIAMFSKTAVAKLFRVWVLDILDKETSNPIQYGLKDKQPDPINEPLKLPFATKEQREPLVRAVRRLVSVASEKGKSISYENAHSIINLKMGVSSVEELTLEQIPQAMALVGDILERVVLEGEFIAKGEPEPQAKVEPEIPSDPFTNREREQLQKIVGSLSGRFNFSNVWTSAIHYRLRKATGCKSPNYFRISDKPVMAKEFGQIFTIISKVQSVIRKVELESAKRLMRNDEEFETVIAELETDCKTLLSELEGEVKTLLDTCDRYEIERFAV